MSSTVSLTVLNLTNDLESLARDPFSDGDLPTTCQRRRAPARKHCQPIMSRLLTNHHSLNWPSAQLVRITPWSSISIVIRMEILRITCRTLCYGVFTNYVYRRLIAVRAASRQQQLLKPRGLDGPRYDTRDGQNQRLQERFRIFPPRAALIGSGSIWS
jgi:hypothetical protein